MKKNVSTFLLCLTAIALNFLVAFTFCDWLHIPIFMDTIFTVAITFYCGLVPGIVVAILYNVIATLTLVMRGFTFEIYAVLFAICGVLVALTTWFFARRRENFQINTSITSLYLVLIALVSSLLAVFSGGTIDYIRYSLADLPDRMAPIKNFTDAFRDQNFPLYASCILGQLPISFLDRIVTTFSGYGVYRLMVRLFGEERW